jgi:hypothetical protein
MKIISWTWKAVFSGEGFNGELSTEIIRGQISGFVAL